MTPRAKGAIGRLVATRGDGTLVAGTAFLVSDRYLLTAFHVVGDRTASVSCGMPMCYPLLRFELGGLAGAGVDVQLVPGCCDPVADWALLVLDASLVGVRPIPLGEVSQREMDQLRPPERNLGFESWGFPRLAQMSGSGITLDGRLQDRNAEYQDAWAYELYSDQAAAALGNPLNGLSGAPCIIDGAVVGIIRSNLLDPSLLPGKSANIVAGKLYACPIATPTLQERCVRYLPSLDPLRGLPGLPRQKLPLEPFRYLHWYGAEHAEVFFGRNRKIRELYLQSTGEDVPSVLLVYGASGVGKSSLLEAGVLPRLSLNYTVKVQRREAGKTLVQSFDAQFTAAKVDAQVSGKPVVILLDQIEEVFTDPEVDGKAEVVGLAQRVKAVLSQAEQPLRIMLGFRSEWLPNVRTRLAEVAVPVSEFFLERLARDEIEEVVAGIASTERLQQFYRVAVDDELPRRVADALLTDPQSPVSPVLSIILTRLWEEAKSHRAGEQRLSQAVYDERMRHRLDLDQFLTDQIQAVAATRPQDVASGLVNDVLYRHTTELGTARELNWFELQPTYAHLGSDDEYLRGLIMLLSDKSLLYSVDSNLLGQSVTRLAHDTLAPLVRKRFETSVLPGQRAERILRARVGAHGLESSPAALDADDLGVVERGVDGMRRLSETELEVIAASRLKRDKAVRLRCIVRRSAYTATAVIVMLCIVSVFTWHKADSAQQNAENFYNAAIRQRANNFADLGYLKIKQNSGAAVRLALAAAELDRSNPKSADLLKKALSTPPEWGRIGAGDKFASCSETALLTGGKLSDVLTGDEGRSNRLFIAANYKLTVQADADEANVVLRRIPDGKIVSSRPRQTSENFQRPLSATSELYISSHNDHGSGAVTEFAIYSLDPEKFSKPLLRISARLVATAAGNWPAVALGHDGSLRIYDSDGTSRDFPQKWPAAKRVFVHPDGKSAVLFERDRLVWLSLEPNNTKYIPTAWSALDISEEPTSFYAVSDLRWTSTSGRFFVLHASGEMLSSPNRDDGSWEKVQLIAVDAKLGAVKTIRETPFKVTGLNRPVFDVAANGARVMLAVQKVGDRSPTIEISDVVWDQFGVAERRPLDMFARKDASLNDRAFPAVARFSSDGSQMISAVNVNTTEFFGGGQIAIWYPQVYTTGEPRRWAPTFLSTGAVKWRFGDRDDLTCQIVNVGFSDDASKIVAVDSDQVAHYFRISKDDSLLPVEWSTRLSAPNVTVFNGGRYQFVRYGDGKSELYDMRLGHQVMLNNSLSQQIFDVSFIPSSNQLVLVGDRDVMVVEEGRVVATHALLYPATEANNDETLTTVWERDGRYRFYSVTGRHIGPLRMDVEGRAFRAALENVSTGALIVGHSPFWYQSPWKQISKNAFRRLMTSDGYVLSWEMVFDEVSQEFVVRQGKLRIDARKLGEDWDWLSATWGVEDEVVFVNRGKYSGRNSELFQFDSNTGEEIGRYEPPAAGWPRQMLQVMQSFIVGDKTYVAFRIYQETGQQIYLGVWNRRGGKPISFESLGLGDKVVWHEGSSIREPGRICIARGYTGNWQWIFLRLSDLSLEFEYSASEGRFEDLQPFVDFGRAPFVRDDEFVKEVEQHVAMRDPGYWKDVSVVPVRELDEGTDAIDRMR